VSTFDIDVILAQMADALRQALTRDGRDRPLMVGIRTGGVWVAERLHALLGLAEPLGELSINFYRDDFTRIGLHPRVQASSLPVHVDDRDILLVDDVLQTGRTIRAALNEIFDYGRPASVTLAVLVDRGGHELPIRADVVGTAVSLGPDQQIKLTGPEPLTLESFSAREPGH
jgi:pyrimidine operon attenuation protein/uracil phosphoribosyltransferase